jgi:general secretion pathway protein D
VATNRLLAMGTAQQLEQLERLIRELDQREPQVLIEATALSISESDARALGVELQKFGSNEQTLYSLGSLFGLGGVGPLEPSLPALQSSGGSALVLDPGSYSILVRALESVQDGRSLASPKLLVSNYQTAELYSVLQTPFQSTNASTTVATTSFGGTQDAGTQIQVTPRITQGEELQLEYSISVSSFVGESADPALPPPRQETKLKSSANIPDGFAIILGGLEIETLGTARSQVPWLGSIPLLGELFASQTRSTEKSRFFVFLKVSILRTSSFEDLRQISETQALELGLDPSWPRLEPRMIR